MGKKYSFEVSRPENKIDLSVRFLHPVYLIILQLLPDTTHSYNLETKTIKKL